ncbi:MAG: cupin domain-containing protein [Chloroflexota bacterium]|nr:MAG: cupin domain-containing protein [Chloroflexota bacterium]
MPTPFDPSAVFGARATTPQVEIFPGVFRRTVVWSERVMVCEINLPRGTTVPPHSHVHEQCGYLVRGLLRFTIGGQTADIAVGGGWFVPSGVTHSVEAIEDTIAIDIFSPVREEYK